MVGVHQCTFFDVDSELDQSALHFGTVERQLRLADLAMRGLKIIDARERRPVSWPS
jgi:hypothetical protein